MANEDKSVRYHRLRRRVALLGSAWQILCLLGLMVTGASLALRASIESLAGPRLIPVVGIYVITVAALCESVLLPLAFYRDVVLERRYGLSTERGASWLANHLKSALVFLVCLIAAGIVVSGLLRWNSDWWWAAASAVFAAVLVMVARFAPVLLLPRFYDVKPLASPSLRTRLLDLATRAGTPVVGAFEWRVGDRTRKANAALVGVGRTRRILVSDTLLAAHSDAEIEAIFAHELAHHVYGDIWIALALDAALVALGCYLADRALTAYGGAFGLAGKTDVAGLPLLVLAGGAVSLVLLPVANVLSRAQERRADRYALDATGNAPAFISAMKRLAARNLAEERPSRIVEVLFHTHPTTTDRIEAAQAWALGSRLSALNPTLEPSGREPKA